MTTAFADNVLGGITPASCQPKFTLNNQGTLNLVRDIANERRVAYGAQQSFSYRIPPLLGVLPGDVFANIAQRAHGIAARRSNRSRKFAIPIRSAHRQCDPVSPMWLGPLKPTWACVSTMPYFAGDFRPFCVLGTEQ